MFFITSVAFFLFDATTIDEYGISFYALISILNATINILTMARKMPNILTIIGKIGKYEELIDGKELLAF